MSTLDYPFVSIRDLSRPEYSKAHLKAVLVWRGMTFARSSTKAQLAKLVHCADTGQLVYSSCPSKTLRGFLKARNMEHHSLKTKAFLVRRLERGDAERRLPFMRLSRELRDEVYMHAAQDPWYEALWQPVQPHVTRVCRQLRVEALDVFYRRMIFGIDMARVVDKDGGSLGEFDYGAACWLRDLPYSNLARIRHLNLRWAPRHGLEGITIDFHRHANIMIARVVFDTERADCKFLGEASPAILIQRIQYGSKDLERWLKNLLRKLGQGTLTGDEVQNWCVGMGKSPGL